MFKVYVRDLSYVFTSVNEKNISVIILFLNFLHCFVELNSYKITCLLTIFNDREKKTFF